MFRIARIVGFVDSPASLMTTLQAHSGPDALKSPPFEAIRKDLAQVETAVGEQINAFDPAVEPYISYVCNTSGKRIRPALSILTGRALGGSGADSVQLGVIIELIHMATLVHDDIIDGATTRRTMPTANAKWGNSLAVLLGDALFSHALALATDFDDNAVARKVGLASRQVCQGEIIQTQRRFDLALGKGDYFRIIEMKTGALFEAATGIAAMIAGAPPEIEERVAAYGMQLGTAYQIYDDCLDIIGTEQAAGKTLRTDLAKGKLTLPILNLLENATETQRTKLTRRILDQERHRIEPARKRPSQPRPARTIGMVERLGRHHALRRRTPRKLSAMTHDRPEFM